MKPVDDWRLETEGAELWRAAATKHLFNLRAVSAKLPQGEPGLRLTRQPGLGEVISDIDKRVSNRAGRVAWPVRMILFDKSHATNWALGWHQDRTIVVRNRRDVPGFGPWTVKANLLHVAPPIEVLEQMITVRIHLDVVNKVNAPLKIALGSHRLGRIAEADIERIVEASRLADCYAKAGDVWAYSTPILHASEATTSQSRRRVLQIDYAADELPDGLEWLGV